MGARAIISPSVCLTATVAPLYSFKKHDAPPSHFTSPKYTSGVSTDTPNNIYCPGLHCHRYGNGLPHCFLNNDGLLSNQMENFEYRQRPYIFVPHSLVSFLCDNLENIYLDSLGLYGTHWAGSLLPGHHPATVKTEDVLSPSRQGRNVGRRRNMVNKRSGKYD